MLRTLLLSLSALALVSCDAPPQSLTAATSEPATDKMHQRPPVDPAAAAAAVAELEKWDAVIEVMHDEGLAVQWTIGVKDDGTKRYGLAESVCGELSDRHLVHDLTWVRIVDRRAVMSNGGDFRAASLGSVKCATGDWIDP